MYSRSTDYAVSNASVKLVGNDKLMRHMNKMSNPKKVFDGDYQKTIQFSTLEFRDKTSKMTGNTARGWVPKKVGLSDYRIFNDVKTGDGKHLIVEILDLGHGEIRPVKAKMLYIPLTDKGRSKKAGEKIPKGLVFGVDYVMAKKVKAVKGLNFKSPILKESSKVLTKGIVKTIRRVHSGK